MTSERVETAWDEADDAEPWEAGPSTWVPWAALLLSLLGVADSTYLTITHFDPAVLACSTKGFIDCAAVTTSPQSRLLGIPVAFLGLAFYIAMTAINLPPLWRIADPRVAWLRLAMAVSGMAMVLWLLYAELIILKHLCEFCTVVHCVTFLMFVLVVLTMPDMLARSRSEATGYPIRPVRELPHEPATPSALLDGRHSDGS